MVGLKQMLPRMADLIAAGRDRFFHSRPEGDATRLLVSVLLIFFAVSRFISLDRILGQK